MLRRNSFAFLVSLLFISVQILGCGSSKHPITIAGTLPATGTVGAGYTGTLTATGGEGGYTWTATGLPPGVMAAGNTTSMLTVSGTPTTAGSYPVMISIADGKKDIQSYSVTVVISAATGPSISGTLPATGTVGVAYTGSLTASGGTGPYTWMITGLPTGLNYSGSPTVTVVGMPSAAGTFPVTATVTDSAQHTATYTVSIVISAAAGNLAVSLPSGYPESGTVGTAYTAPAPNVTGGTPPYTYSFAQNAPPGLMMAAMTGIVTGTPTTAGTFHPTIKVTDSATPANVGYVNYTITIGGGGLSISGSLPATGTVGVAYMGSLTAVGGTAPYSWVITGFPAAFMISGAASPTVTVSGTPAAATTYNVSVTLMDSATHSQMSNVTVVISAAGSLAVALPSGYPKTGTVGTAYSAPAPNVTGGTPPYTYAFAQNTPPGLTMSPTLGTVSGTPTKAGTFNPTIKVTDSATPANIGYTNYVFVVSGSGGQTLSIAPTTLGTLTNGTAVTPIALTITPATTAPYTWSVTSGALPTGLVLNNGTTTNVSTITSTTTSINITGTPTVTGPYSFTISVTDSAASVGSGSQAFSGSVSAATSNAVCAATPALRGNEAALTAPYAFLLKGADGGDLPVAWAGSFTPNGSGGISASDIDFVGSTDGPESLQVQLAGSSYSFGADGRGCLYLAFSAENPGVRPVPVASGRAPMKFGSARKQIKARREVLPNVGTVVFSFVVSATNKVGRITQFDYTNSQTVAAGQMEEQTPANFAVTQLASNFAFGADGWVTVDAQGDIVRGAIAGSFANTAGTLSGGVADENVDGTAYSGLDGGTGSFTGSTVSTTTGRGTGNYTASTVQGLDTFHFAYYIVNSDDIYFISTDDPTPMDAAILSGRALVRPATSSALNGYYLPALTGIDLNEGQPGIGANYAAVGTLQATSAGTIPSATLYANDAGSYAPSTFTNGSYTLEAASGRVVFTGGAAPPIAYLTGTASANEIAGFLVGTDEFSSSGFLAFQGTAAPSYSVASLSGSYAFGTAEDVTGVQGSEDGAFTFNGAGNYTATVDQVSVGGGGSANVVSAGTYTVNSDGSGSLTAGAASVASVTNGTVTLAIDEDSDQPLLYIFVAQ